MLIIVAPWMIAIGLATRGTFFTQAVGEDLLPKLMGGHESHGGPTGLYLLLVFATFWPGSLFMWQALARAWQERLDPVVRFLLCWLVPSWLVFELIPTKLPHYVLPMYPALALLCGRIVSRSADITLKLGKYDLQNLVRVLWTVVLGLLPLGAALLPMVVERRMDWPALIAGLAGLAIFYYVLKLFRSNRQDLVILPALLSALLVLGVAMQFTLPNMRSVWPSLLAHEMAQAHTTPGQKEPQPLLVVGYAEASLIFHHGTKQTALVNYITAANRVARGQGDTILVTDHRLNRVMQALRLRGYTAKLLAQARAQHYSKGRWITMYLFRARKLAPQNQAHSGVTPWT